MLTRKQQELLLYIHERILEDGVPPSFDEMKDALELKSKSGIHRLITALEERGFIRRLANRARALEIIKMPDHGISQGAATSAAPANQDGGSVIRADFSARRRLSEADAPPTNVHAFPGGDTAAEEDNYGFAVPVMGRIAAGVPISAIQDNTHSITVPPQMIGSGEYFALQVEGDSMVEAGIHDGDTVVIRQDATANAGDIVVALVDEEEATLKTFRRNGSEIVLEAANPAYENRVFTSDRVKVQGRLVGLIRQYH